jgi:acetylornithine deacetylase
VPRRKVELRRTPTDEALSKVYEDIDKARSEVVDFTSELVQMPSISGTQEEGDAQKAVIRELNRMGALKLDVWKPELDEVNKYPLHPIRDKDWNYENRSNVVAVRTGSGGGRSLMLNGHIDVVSAEPVTGWKQDPWGGKVVRGKLYGRGSMDMKGGLAAMLFAMKALEAGGVRLRGDLIFESVLEEEFGGGGTVAALVRGYSADAAIVGESTSSDSVCIASGGSRFFNIRITGKPEWPHLAHRGVNAIELSSKVYHELISLDKSRERRLRGKHPIMETLKAGGGSARGRASNMTVGVLTAGDWPATVAGWAEMKGRVGFPPSERGADVQKEIESSVHKMARKDAWMKNHPPSVEWWGARREAYEVPRDSPIVKTIEGSVKSVVGPCTLFGTSSASDAAFLVPKVGAYGGIPTVWYGPGGAGAHTFDEYVIADEIIETAKVYAKTAVDWCGVQS